MRKRHSVAFCLNAEQKCSRQRCGRSHANVSARRTTLRGDRPSIVPSTGIYLVLSRRTKCFIEHSLLSLPPPPWLRSRSDECFRCWPFRWSWCRRACDGRTCDSRPRPRRQYWRSIRGWPRWAGLWQVWSQRRLWWLRRMPRLWVQLQLWLRMPRLRCCPLIGGVIGGILGGRHR
jgi:hypothetical protein